MRLKGPKGSVPRSLFAILSLLAACGGDLDSEMAEGEDAESAFEGTRDDRALASSSLPFTSVVASADDGNRPINVTDNNLSTRWSCYGSGCWVKADLGGDRTLSSVDVAWHQGNRRKNDFSISISRDGRTWAEVFSGRSAGTGTGAERYPLLGGTLARYVRLNVLGNTVSDWNSVTELKVYGFRPPPKTTQSYDQLVISHRPVGFWAMRGASATEADLSGRGAPGNYRGGTPSTIAMPNGDRATHFNGTSQYLTIPSRASFSIPTTGELTWEGWIRADTLQFPNSRGGYVDWLGKCQVYSPTCEWEARFYSTSTPENRPNRLSAYAFNPTAGVGSGGDWQPAPNSLRAGVWYHVVGQYTTRSTPSDCSTAYPGRIDIWVNGVEWNRTAKGRTGCMSQYGVRPGARNSPVNVGTMSFETFFPGAVGKVAIYDRRLTRDEIAAHYKAMTGLDPSGVCGKETCALIGP